MGCQSLLGERERVSENEGENEGENERENEGEREREREIERERGRVREPPTHTYTHTTCKHNAMVQGGDTTRWCREGAWRFPSNSESARRTS
jgi:hypothetical protein